MKKRIFTTLLGFIVASIIALPRSASAAPLTYIIDTPQVLSDGGSISGFFTYDPAGGPSAFAGAFHIVTGVGSVITTAQIYDSGIGCAGGLTQSSSFNCDLGNGSGDFEIEMFGPQGSPEVYFPFSEHLETFGQFRLGGMTPTPNGGSPSILAHPGEVPEPSSMLLLGSGLVGLMIARRRHANANAR
jgi:hypothetical protein